jgi:PAS domain S-box-containing protein
VAFIEEAMKWIPEENGAPSIVADDLLSGEFLSQGGSASKKFKVVLADDNADMRDYVQRLLTSQYQVITAADGEEAFQKVLRFRPDLLLSDSMMPRLDGFGLLEKVRNHPDTKNLPVIFLSARAGDEAKVEGLEAGADDYLVKPFSSKELLARVDANIKIAKNREAAENNLRNVIRQSPIATTLLRGPEFMIDIVNDKGLELWGRSYEEVINKPILHVLPELAGQGFDQLLAQVYHSGIAYRGNETPVELVRFGKPETFYLNFIYEPLRNEGNEVSGVIAIAVDITEQVLARKKLEQSEKEWNELANAVPQLVWVASPEGAIIYYNERVGEYAGAHKNEDGTWSWEGLVHTEDRSLTEQAWTQAVSNGTVYQIEHRVQMKDGRFRWHLSRAIPYRDESGAIIKWFGSATDIHISRVQSALLEEEVKKRTAELYELNLSLQRSNNELQQFAHVASHDLKEPLRKIKTFTGRLADDPGNTFTERSKTFLQKVNSASDRMFAMIEGVLNYSVLNTSEQVIEPVSFQTIMQHIEADLELLITQKAASLQYSNLPSAEGSFVLLYQLLYNLVNNSLKFAKKDVPPVITITSTISNEQQEWVTLTVKDNGIGFAQEYAEKIFESFTRLNSKDQFEGTGLGLSLCQRIAERHGGRIDAIGKPGEGACFWVRLPLRQNRSSI